MIRFTAKMNYSEDTVYKLTEMQHRTFQTSQRLVMIIAAIVSLLFGFRLGFGSITGILFTFFGCILLTGLNSRPRATAKAFVAELKGKYPLLVYTFSDNGFSSQEEERETPYSSIIKLVDDGEYLFIYVSTEKAYMIETSSVRSQTGNADFKEYIAKKASLSWTRPLNLFNFNIKALKGMIRK